VQSWKVGGVAFVLGTVERARSDDEYGQGSTDEADETEVAGLFLIGMVLVDR